MKVLPKLCNVFTNNFQKHAIVTFKNLMSLNGLDKSKEIFHVVRKIWNLYLDSNGRSKEIFVVMFGEYDPEDDPIIKIFRKYHFD